MFSADERVDSIERFFRAIGQDLNGRIYRGVECRLQPGMRRNIVAAELDLFAAASRLPGMASHAVTAFDEFPVNSWRRRRVLLAGVAAALAGFHQAAIVARSNQYAVRSQIAGDVHLDDDVVGELAAALWRGGLCGRLHQGAGFLERLARHSSRKGERHLIEPAQQLVESLHAGDGEAVSHYSNRL